MYKMQAFYFKYKCVSKNKKIQIFCNKNRIWSPIKGGFWWWRTEVWTLITGVGHWHGLGHWHRGWATAYDAHTASSVCLVRVLAPLFRMLLPAVARPDRQPSWLKNWVLLPRWETQEFYTWLLQVFAEQTSRWKISCLLSVSVHSLLHIVWISQKVLVVYKACEIRIIYLK